jgi:hypothetical protein
MERPFWERKSAEEAGNREATVTVPPTHGPVQEIESIL